MKKKTLLQYTSTFVGTLALLAAAPVGAVPNDTWNGGGSPDGNWSNANNWGGVAPGANDSLFFDGSTQNLVTNDFAAGTIFTTLNFNPSASPFTLSGNAVTLPTPSAANYALNNLNPTYLDGGITNFSGSPQTISLPLVLTNGHHYFIGNAGGGTLNVSGPVSLSVAASASFSDGNSVNLTGSGLANVNDILGGWATMSPPTSWASLDASSNVVAYTAFTDVAAGGAIASAAASNVRVTSSGGNVTLASATLTDINSLFCPDMGGNETVDVAAGKILRFGPKGGILNASRQLGTSRVLTIGTAVNVGYVTAGGAPNTPGDLYLIETPLIGNTGNQITMNSRITNNGTGAVAVHTFGHISFPAVVHTYSGGTYIHGGRIQATGPNTLGFGPVYVYPGGQLFLNNTGPYTNAMFIAGLGNGESTGNGAIRMGTRVISGTVTLMADAATANGTINGKITGPGGLIVGAGSGNGVGTLIISVANDYAGNTTINGQNSTAASTLQIAAGKPNIMPHGAGKGNLFLNGAAITPSVATFDLNSTVQTINGLNSTGTVARAVITSSSAGSSTLIVGDNDANGTFGGTIQNGATGGAGYVGLTKIGAGTQTISGVSTYTGDTIVNGGKLVFGTGASVNNSTNLTINSNATLNVAAICPVTQSGAGKAMTSSNGTTVVALQGAGSAVTTPTLNSFGSTNFITIAQIPAISSYPVQLTAIKYTTLNGTLNFGLAGALPASPGAVYAGYVSNNVANGSVDFVVTAGPVSLKWAGYDGVGLNQAWDTSTPDWKLGNGSLTAYADGVFANFDDSASNGIVSLNQNVNPAGITVSNNVLTYTNIGGGKITGTGGLVKQGPGRLLLDNSNPNDFTGGLAIQGGTVQVGDNDGNGYLPTGGSIVNNGNLTFSHIDTVMDTSLISGTGTLTQNGNGILNLAGANTFTGAVTVVKGTLQTGNSSALGTTNGIVTVQSGATLDVTANAINLGQKRIVVSGTGVGGVGALINSSGSTTFVGPNAARVTLAGDTTFGGSGRFDLRSATTSDSSLSSLSTGGNPYKLTVATAGSTIAFGLIGCTVDPALGDIDIRSGILSLEAATTGLGNTASNLSIWPGGTLQMFAITNRLNKVITMGGDGSVNSVSATSGSSTVIGPMNVTNDCIFSVNNAAVSLTLNNVISGVGKITKIGLGSLTFAGNSPAYEGGILVSAGSVALSGSMTNLQGVQVNIGKFALNGTLTGGGITNGSGATVAGSGTNAAMADIFGNLFPGDTNGVIGTFTTGGLILEGGAALNYDLGPTTGVGGGTNDLIVVNGDLVINANAVTINPVGLLKTGPGNPYRLFNYTGSLTVNGDLSVNGPQGYNFTVDTSTAGQVNVVVSGGPPVWNGGSATDSNWSDSANWGGVTPSSGNTLYFAGTTRLNNTNDTVADTSYQDLAFNTDAGAFILNGNPVALAGNVVNNSTNTQTIKLGLDFSTGRTFNGGTNAGAAGLIIGGGITNTAGLLTTTLAGNGILTNLIACTDPTAMTNIISINSNSSWVLMDNPASAAITTPVQFDVLAGTFTYGSPTSAPNMTSTAAANVSRVGVTVGAPATFNMVNGTLTLTSRLNTGAAANAIANINQSGGTLNVALMQSSDSSANALTTLNFTGGTFNSIAGTPQTFYLASRGTGIVTVASSAAVNCSTFDLSRNAAGNTSGSIGVVNLNGGVINCTRVGTATGAAQAGPPTAGPVPTATFNFNGGVLKAAASSATFFQGNVSSPAIPIVSIVKAGGAIIDTTNFNISVLEPLQHDSTLGAGPDGGLLKKGVGALTLTAVSTYTGPTVVTNGTLIVNGTLGLTTVSVATNATLAGTGTLGSNATVNAGGTIAPAGVGALGTLTVVSNVTLLGTVTMDLNATTVTNDVLKAGSITYGGTLTVTNIAGTLAAGNSFKLFNSSSITGTFAATNLPALNTGLGWVTTNLANGIISIVQTVNTSPTNLTTMVSGNTLTLSWPADHTGWRLQVQTNSLSTGLNTNWTDVPGSTTVNSVNATLDPANGTVFYRMVYP